ncbi:uncharacterized protein PHACADRAFT_212410 [Phanerochaete carnosa HHB-10118-sp]|uniref:F-box domain-containing protein n=1 Tax=Phanerochaete carnosa (strain HHB-10118-sp) TaxID=650164 RepID=K5VYZ0_PHACS|nr:uncharacterized protein PHACADRAFT_212410 [Phanerochaete carnosa HHB-10118-sp]EKM51794.1 hypothetical protein PHACADRAFT_212410 [Phanerochaete carnosa HHB-10118-sp]
MRLDWDILVEIMSVLSRADASRMSRTCRVLLHAAPPTLLKGQVVLWSMTYLLSFHQFMFRDKHKCFHHLRVLILKDAIHHITGAGDLLVDIFTHSTDLERLKVFTSELIDADDRIPPALSALKQLHTIELFSITEHTIDMLKQIQAPLTTARVSLGRLIGPGGRAGIDPISIFARFKDYLRVVDVIHAEFASAGFRYSRVDTLSVIYINNELRPLLHCFPNLKNRQLLPMPSLRWRPLNDRHVEEQRRFNMTSPTSWSSFNRLIGTDPRSGSRELPVEDIDVHAIAENAMRYIPTIQRVGINIGQKPYMYEVQQKEEQHNLRSLVALPSDMAVNAEFALYQGTW